MINNSLVKTSNFDWKNFCSTLTEFCKFTALTGLLIGTLGMIIGGLKGAQDPHYFFGLQNWPEGLIIGGLTGLITPIAICTIVALATACLVEAYFHFSNSK